MPSIGFHREDIQALLALACQANVRELEVEHNGALVRIIREQSERPLAIPVERSAEDPPSEAIVCSSWVGSFQPLGHVGQEVKRGEIIGSVEALRMVHPVEAPADGIVEELLAEANHAVEYGQQLARLRLLTLRAE